MCFSLLSEEEDCLESVSTSVRPNLLCLYQCHRAKSNDGSCKTDREQQTIRRNFHKDRSSNGRKDKSFKVLSKFVHSDKLLSVYQVVTKFQNVVILFDCEPA